MAKTEDRELQESLSMHACGTCFKKRLTQFEKPVNCREYAPLQRELQGFEPP
jgi:hypothetical protein